MSQSNQHITINKLVGKDAIEAVRAEYRKELEALLLGEGAPEDMTAALHDKETHPRLHYRSKGFNTANAVWRQHIHNVLKGKG